jgi:UDP-glucose 4-epimerase
MNHRILVVGAAGFIGRHLVRALRNDGWTVRAQVHRCIGEFPADVEVIDSDTPGSMAIANCDAVAWLAAATTPASSAEDCSREVHQNLAPLCAALQAMPLAPTPPHLVYFSSGGTLYGDVDEPAEESFPLHPRSNYAAGKAAAEFFIAACAQRTGLRATILRPSNVYGPGQALHGGFGVIPAAMDCLLQLRPMTVWGDGNSLRDYLYIDDFIHAVALVLRSPPRRGMQTYNVCSGYETRLNDLLGRIERVSGRQLQREYRAARGTDLARVALNGNLLRRTLGWQSAVGLDDGLRRTWEWVSSQTSQT